MSSRSGHRALPLIALAMAAVMNLLNLFEPLTVDDVCHEYYAAQVAAHPTDPYGFLVPWHQRPKSAWLIMVAPGNSYYWAPAIALFGDSPIAWHLWFLPLQWLFCYSLLVLLRRWARPHATALTAAIALGPAVLPGINLMLELPMLALAFTSLACLLRAFDQRSNRLAIAAGCLLGLALQTKYSAMGFFVPWLLLGALQRRWRETLLGLAAMLVVALGIEALVAWSHDGSSYFWQQAVHAPHRDWNHILRGFVLQFAVLGMVPALLALRGLAVPRWLWALVVAAYAIGYLGVWMAPSGAKSPASGLRLDSVGYLLMALASWGIAAVFFARLSMRTWRAVRAGRFGRSAAAGVFFVGWFASEIVTSLVLSPFPAARRVLMLVVAFTCAAGWWSSRRRGGAGTLRAIVASSVLLGIGYQALDMVEGFAAVDAARGTMAYARKVDDKARVFFTGGWSFEFYAPRAGMQPLLRDATVVERGDWIAVGHVEGIEQPWFEWDDRIEKVVELDFGTDGVPLSVQLGYYSGRRPIDHQSGARYRVTLCRARAPFRGVDLVARPDLWLDE